MRTNKMGCATLVRRERRLAPLVKELFHGGKVGREGCVVTRACKETRRLRDDLARVDVDLSHTHTASDRAEVPQRSAGPKNVRFAAPHEDRERVLAARSRHFCVFAADGRARRRGRARGPKGGGTRRGARCSIDRCRRVLKARGRRSDFPLFFNAPSTPKT